MDYQIQNLTANYQSELRKLFVEEFTLIPKHLRLELDHYIKIIDEQSKLFIQAYLNLMDQSDKEMTKKYLS